MSGTSLRDQWIGWRNDLLSNSRFQHWAADFPLTRPIAHRRAQGLFDLVAGFVYSQTLAACVRLRLLQHLRDGPRTTIALAQILDLPLVATERLMKAAGALRLVEAAGANRYALGAQGAALLGNPGLLEMIDHHRHLYADLADGVGLLRRGGGQGDLAAYWPYAGSSSPDAAKPEDVSAYSALMAATLPSVAADLFQAYPIRRHRRLLDVGGGEGAFLALAAQQAPRLGLMLFDLPAVTKRAQRRLACAGVLERAEIFAGDFLSEPIPAGADLVTLVRILHDHDDAGAMRLLRSIREAMPADGALLIAEPMSAAPKTDRVADVYFGLYLLAMGRGWARTPDEIATLLHAAGFRHVRNLRTRTPFLTRAIVARP